MLQEVLDYFRAGCLALLHKMAACITLRSTVRRALLGLQSRTSGPPFAAVGLRFLGDTAPEEHKSAIVESTEEYKFVERLIPPSRVPAPPKHAGPTPSGWKPPADSPPSLPYMIRRSRMHNIPVYTDLTNGNRMITLIRKVEGDIWALEKDMKLYLKEVTGKDLPTQVNEVTGTVKVKGQFDVALKEWLVNKGFWVSWPGDPRLSHNVHGTDGVDYTCFAYFQTWISLKGFFFNVFQRTAEAVGC